MNDKVIINTKNEALELISDIANDYDNCKTIEQFKALVDEMAEYAKRGLKLDK